MALPDNSVSVVTSSQEVSGSGTNFIGAENDLFVAGGAVVPIASVQSPNKLTLKQPWPIASLTGASFNILSLGEYWRQVIPLNKRLVELLSKWEIVSPFKFDVAGSLEDRNNYDNQPRGFVYVATDQLPVRIFFKTANTNSSSDWSIPIFLGNGGQVEFQEALSDETTKRTQADQALGNRIDDVDRSIDKNVRRDLNQITDRTGLLEDFRDDAVIALDNLSEGIVAERDRAVSDLTTEAETRAAEDAKARFGFGDVYALVRPVTTFSPASGAQPAKLPEPDGRTMGAYIPAGSTGANATVEYPFPVDTGGLPSFNDRLVRMGLTINVNALFARDIVIGLNTVSKTGQVRSVQLSKYMLMRAFSTQFLAIIEFATTGDEAKFSVYILNRSGVVALQDDYWTLVALTSTIIWTPSGTTTPADENLTLGVATGLIRALTAAQSLTDAEKARAQLAEVALGSGFGEVYSGIMPVPQLASPTGAFPATLPAPDGRAMGAYIVAGGSAAGAVVKYPFAFNELRTLTLPGREVRLVLAFNVNPAFSRDFIVGLNTLTDAGQTRSVAPLTYRTLRPFPTLLIVILSFITVGDEVAIEPYGKIQTAQVTAQDDYFTLSFLAGRIETSNSLLTTLADENEWLAADRTVQRAAVKALASAVELVTYDGEVYAKEITIREDGSGQYLSPVQAEAAITDATATNKYVLNIGPGTYNTIVGNKEWQPKGFVHIRGAGAGKTILSGRQPANTPLGQVEEFSTCRFKGETWMSGGTSIAEGARYASHPEDSGANPNTVNRYQDWEFIHLGNDAVVAYQQSLSNGNPGGVWQSMHAWGAGGASGQLWDFDRCLFLSPEIGFYFHDNADFKKPMRVRLHNSRLLTRGRRVPGVNCGSLWLDSLGSGVTNQCELLNNQMDGPIIMGFQPRCSIRPEMQLADSVSWHISGSGNNPVPFVMFDDGARSLVFTSADAANGTPITFGTSATSAQAIAALFGEVRVRRGVPGWAASLEGKWDVGKHPVGPNNANLYITHLGYRLGDRRSDPWTLPVTANGITKTIVFNQDYRLLEQQPIIDAINYMMTPGVGIASLVWIASRYRPHFWDQEETLCNTSAVAIPSNYGVVFDGSAQDIRLAQSGDPASRFAGVTMEVILPGEHGRVKRRGTSAVWMDIARSEGSGFTYGDTFGIGPTPGLFAKGAGVPLLRARNAIDVEWGL